MYGGDRENQFGGIWFPDGVGFWQRPLKFEGDSGTGETSDLCQCHPADYELVGKWRHYRWTGYPSTGLLDPVIEITPQSESDWRPDGRYSNASKRRTMYWWPRLPNAHGEELTEYLLRNDIRCNYIPQRWLDTGTRQDYGWSRQGVWCTGGCEFSYVWRSGLARNCLWSPFWMQTKEGFPSTPPFSDPDSGRAALAISMEK